MNQISDFNNFSIRNANQSDYDQIIAIQPDWWDGRDLTGLILKLFFIHFRNTIYIAEKDEELVGFLIGFFSQYFHDQAYIHFVGIHPNYRKKGLGKILYETFFNLCEKNNRPIVHSITSPINKASIKFHTCLGFLIEPGDGKIDGIPVTLNYRKKNDPKVLFKKLLQ